VTLWESEGDLEATVEEKPSFGIVRVTAAQLREAGFAIARKPLDHNPNHCECFGKPNQKRRSALSKVAVWVKPPDDCDAADFGELDSL